MPDSSAQEDRTRRFDLRALYESSQLMSSSLDLEFILNNLLLTLMSKLFVTRGAVLLREDAGRYVVKVSKGCPSLRVGDEINLGDYSTDELVTGDALPGQVSTHKLALLVPIVSGGTELGLAAVGKKATGEDFNKYELEFIKSLVNMTSSAINNSMVVEELRRTNRDLDNKIQQLNTLFDISQEFNATVDRDRLVKLLSFALMGQMLVRKHLFLLRRSITDQNGAPVDDHIEVVSMKGLKKDDVNEVFLRQVCAIDHNVIVNGDHSDAAWLEEKGIALALPIRHQGETCAMLCLGAKVEGTYQPDEIEFLTALGNLAFVSIQNSFLVEEQIEKERLEEEMRLARQIQEGLQPSRLPKIEGIEIAMLALPSRHVAGDYTDVIALGNGRVLLAIGDVTGKGMPASLLMSNLQAALRILVPMDLALEEATSHINRVICENTGFDKFITYFHAIFDPSDRSLTYVNAGHNPPMLMRSDGTMEELDIGGLLLGVMANMPYEYGRVRLYEGDVLAMFTDGVTEAMSPDGEEFEEYRLEALLRESRHLEAEGVLGAVRSAIIEWTGSATALSDDLTMLVVKAVA